MYSVRYIHMSRYIIVNLTILDIDLIMNLGNRKKGLG